MENKAVNHRERMEGWLAELLAPRGEVAGFAAIIGAVAQNADGKGILGWSLAITMRHPLLGQPDLAVTLTVTKLALSLAETRRLVTEALKELDKQADAARSAAFKGVP